MIESSSLRIGTRGSPLALVQAHEVRQRLAARHPGLAAEGAIEIVVIRTTGDAILDRPLTEIGGKNLFTKEIDDALLDGRIDLAVHSMKDVPTWLPDGMVLPTILPREDPRDAFISLLHRDLAAMPAGATVGTASLRRRAQILYRFPHLKVVSLRGNVQTRLRKLRDGTVDATLLAMAGLNRLGLTDAAHDPIAHDDMLPAPAQGAIGIAARGRDRRVLDYLAPIDCATSTLCVAAERALLKTLDGSCRTPIGALAEIDGQLRLRGNITKPDGSGMIAVERRIDTSDPAEARRAGADAGAELKSRGGPDYMVAG